MQAIMRWKTFHQMPISGALVRSRHAINIKERKHNCVYNFLGIQPEPTFVSDELAPGQRVLDVEFIRESASEYGESRDTAKLYVDDQVVIEDPMRAQVGKFTLCGDGLCIGHASADPVGRHYAKNVEIIGGHILGVGVDVSEEQYLDLVIGAMAAFARD